MGGILRFICRVSRKPFFSTFKGNSSVRFSTARVLSYKPSAMQLSPSSRNKAKRLALYLRAQITSGLPWNMDVETPLLRPMRHLLRFVVRWRRKLRSTIGGLLLVTLVGSAWHKSAQESRRLHLCLHSQGTCIFCGPLLSRFSAWWRPLPSLRKQTTVGISVETGKFMLQSEAALQNSRHSTSRPGGNPCKSL
jgi:hypothetical protein